MQNNISYLVPNQVPEYLRDASPLFSDFMRTYYKYAEQRNAGLGLTQSRFLNADIDNTLDEYVHEFYDTYGEYLPSNIALDKRNLIKLLNYIYEAKGTEKALKLVFKTIFNESIEVTYPNVLRASDGKWVQETFITLHTIYGSVQAINDTLIISDEFQQVIEISNAIEIDSATVRIYFSTFNKIEFELNQLIKTYDSNNNVSYIGKLIKSPSKLVIGLPGKAWQRGQVVSIPGTVKNTIARITDVSAIGAALSVEILEHGYIHSENQTTIISPYPNKPVGSTISISSTADGDHFVHQIDIFDYTEGTEESVIGQSPGFTPDSYFLEDYIETDYVMNTVISVTSRSGLTIASSIDPNLTMEEWLLSRATFSYEFGTAVKTKGYYIDDGGQISNSAIRLEDNYFYQAFSYIIESSRDIREYEQLLNITHPAGTKRFSTLAKTANYDLVFGSSRSLSRDIVYLVNSYDVNDVVAITLTKPVTDFVSSSDLAPIIAFTKVITDSANTSAEIFTKTFNKLLTDATSSSTETLVKTAVKPLIDATSSSTETLVKTVDKPLSDSINTSTESFSIGSIKYIYGDSVTVSHPDVFGTIETGFDETDYFAENYATIETLLSIG